MATYVELFELRNNSDLLNKIAVALSVKAQLLIDDAAPTALQLKWARHLIRNPRDEAVFIINYLLAKNKNATVTQIQNVSDNNLQNAVDLIIDKLTSLEV